MTEIQRKEALLGVIAITGLAAGYLLYQAWRRHQTAQTPKEVEPLPLDRAYDRQKNIDYLAENYPRQRYQPPRQSVPQPNPAQDFIAKDEPMRGFHGG